MNFKLTTLKSIISIIVGLILLLYFSFSQTIGIPSKLIFDFNQKSVFGFLVGLIITYLIWSLIQNKK